MDDIGRGVPRSISARYPLLYYYRVWDIREARLDLDKRMTPRLVWQAHANLIRQWDHDLWKSLDGILQSTITLRMILNQYHHQLRSSFPPVVSRTDPHLPHVSCSFRLHVMPELGHRPYQDTHAMQQRKDLTRLAPGLK